MALVMRLEGRRAWLRSGGVSLEASPANLAILQQIPDLQVINAPSEPQSAPLSGKYKSRTEPYPHQVEALRKASERRTLALFMEQGTGKTKVALDYAGSLFTDGQISGMVIVSKKGVHRQWIESEAPKHLGVTWRGCWWKMPAKAWREFHHRQRDPNELELLAINYDGAKTMNGLTELKMFCDRHDNRVLMVCDESQDIKNARSARHKALMDLVQYTSHRMICTGTPIAKDLTDEWAQLRWLDETILGIRYVSSFRNHFCIMGGYQNKQVIGHRNIEKFKQLTAPAVFRVTKDDLGILPKQYSTWHVDLAPAQAEAITDLKRELMTELETGEIVSAANMVSAMNKFAQIAAGFAIDEEGEPRQLMPPTKNPRMIGLLEYLDDANRARSIVWFRFRYEHDLIASQLATNGFSFVSYYGATKDADRAEAVRRFCSDSEDAPQVFLANPQSAGTGLNLQGFCNRAIYWQNSFNAVDRWQSEDRIHRIGTRGVCTYTDIVAKGSIDAHILKNLRRKKGLSDLVLDDLRRIIQDI